MPLSNPSTGGTGDFKADGTVAMTAKIRCPITGTPSAFIGSSGTTSSDVAIWADLSKFYFLNGNNTLYVPVNTGALTAAGLVTSSFGFIHGSTGGLQSNLNGGWGLLNSSLTAYVNATAAKLFVTGATTTYDTAWERGASGRMDSTDGAGNLRDVRARSFISSGGVITLTASTVAGLLSATLNPDSIAVVTDASSPVIGSTVTGGGSTRVLVQSIGSNWVVIGGIAASGGSTPAGTGSELQFRNAGAFGAVTGSSVSGADITLGGSLTSTLGTFVSGVANGASAVAFNFNTPSYTTSGALLRSTQNNGGSKESLDKDGTLTVGNGTTNYIALNGGLNNPTISIKCSNGNIGVLGMDNGYGTYMHPGSVGGGGNSAIYNNSSGAMLGSARSFGWASSANPISQAMVTGIGLNATGVVEINNGTAGTFRDLKLRSLISSGGTITLSNYTVATLPTAASNTHAIVAVTDGNASPTYRGAVTGGGSTKGVVYCDGSSWMWH